MASEYFPGPVDVAFLPGQSSTHAAIADVYGGSPTTYYSYSIRIIW